MHRRDFLRCLAAAPGMGARPGACAAAERDLVGHWPLAGDTRDVSGLGHHGLNRGADLAAPGPGGMPGGAARFDGQAAWIEVPAGPALQLGRGDFTLTAWVHTDAVLDDVLGDLVSQYDPAARRGFTWCLKNGPGMTTSQANDRNLCFGIDSGTEPTWRDGGRPGNAVYVMALAVHDGQLFAGTCEPGKDEAGHVHRSTGDGQWTDCGSPDRCNAVTALAVYQGHLYAGVGRYRLAGSALPESPNPHLGGGVYRYAGDGQWTDCGKLPGIEAVGGLVVYRGSLYASSLYRPAGLFRYTGGRTWVPCPTPADGRRVGPLGVYNGHLYAGTYDGCAVFRFDGDRWEDLGALEPTGQTYAFEVHAGKLHVATWPNGKVYRHEEGMRWTDLGRLGEEKEVMGMAVYNGKLYAGTLPLAEVYRHDGGTTWTRTGRLDQTPDVRYRRAWSVAVYGGRLFCGTLPSGRVHALTAGVCVTHDRGLAPSWQHLAAVRQGNRLQLVVAGRLAATSPAAAGAILDVSTQEPLRIGLGSHDYFRGSLSDLRLYRRALPVAEIAALATPR